MGTEGKEAVFVVTGGVALSFSITTEQLSSVSQSAAMATRGERERELIEIRGIILKQASEN